MSSSRLEKAPNLTDDVTRSQLLDFVLWRDSELRKGREAAIQAYPAKKAAWEETIADKLHERVPRMIELLRQSRYGDLPHGGFPGNQDPVRDIFKDLIPPEAPSFPQNYPDDDWTNQYTPAIAYLESLSSEELTHDQRLILRRLGCFE